MSEQWAVVDEAGVIHEVDVSEGRTGSPPWVAHVADGTARRSLTSARGAVVLMAQARGWGVAEVLAPGQVGREEMAAEIARLEARRGALLEEVDRLTAALAVAREDAEQVRSERDMAADEVERRGDMIRGMRAEIAAARLDGAREMLELVLVTALNAGSPQSTIDALLSLPLPGEEVAAPKVCGFCKGRGMVAYGREIEDACEACCDVGGAQ